MKILIAYASKNGTGDECVRRLCAMLHGLDVTTQNLCEGTCNPAEYELVVFGSSVRFGHLLKPAVNFLKTYEKELLTKPLAMFLCCGLAHEYEYYYDALLPEELKKHAFQTLFFGGDLRPKKAVWWEKLIYRSIRADLLESEIEDGEYTPTLPGILPENISRLSTYIREQMAQ